MTIQPQAVRPTPPPPVAPPAPPPIQPAIVQPPPAWSFAPPPPSPARVQTRKTVKAKGARARISKPARAKQTLPAPSAAKATNSSAPDSTLMIGGLALVVLVLGDTIFLALSARLLRLG